MSKYVDMGIKAIIRPPRHNYDPEKLPPSIFVPNVGVIQRQPLVITNSRGLKLKGSFYSPLDMFPDMPCVVYLHGNASSQLEGSFLVPVFIPAGVSVLCFDFTGCGASEGEYISLGYFERDDVKCAIELVRNTFGVGRVALWGRSMGAATSIYALSDDPTIAGAVLDSPFSSLPDLIKELAENQGIPGFVTSTASWYIGKKIKELADFDIDKVEPIKVAQACFTPILFIHGENDSFIKPEHSRKLHEAYCGEEKQIMIVPGDHNSQRPLHAQIEAILFLGGCLEAPICIDELPEMLNGHYSDDHYGDLGQMLGDM